MKISTRQKTNILALVVGLLASFAAYLLHALIRNIQWLLTIGLHIESFNWLYLILPVVGIWLTAMFVKYIVKDDISHGITRILYAISSKQSHLKGHNTWTSIVASAITIGFGGSVGAEAPIVLTGSSIGSQLGQRFGLDRKQLMLLVGCGASAAIAGIFKAPIAGLVFTLEVLMIDLSMASLVPILISCVTATSFTYVIVGSDALFTFHLDEAWQVDRIPATILLGVACSLVSLYFIRMMTACENMFALMNGHRYAKLFVGGIILSTLIALFPSLYGEGYNALNILLNGKGQEDWDALLNNSLFYGNSDLLIEYVALVIATKVIATSATNGAGGVGGTFAPSLFIGGFSGFLFSRLWNMYELGIYLPEKNFTLLGMAGVMAGVMHAPLTGIFLIAEITGGYNLFMPLIIVSVVSVLTISIFEPHGLYAIRLARQGKLVTHHVDHSVLTLMSIESVIEREYTPLQPDMLLGELVRAISKSQTSFLPVLNKAGVLLGEVDITKIRHIMFRTELYHRFTVRQVMTPVQVTVTMNDPMEHVMEAFEQIHGRYLPVTDIDGQLQGYVSRTRAYSMYRKLVADFSAE